MSTEIDRLTASYAVSLLLSCWAVASAGAQEPILRDGLPANGSETTPKELRAIQTNSLVPDVFLAPSTEKSATKSATLLTMRAKIDISILSYDRTENGLHGIVIRVANKSDRPLLFDGDRAVVSLLGNEYKVAPLAALTPRQSPPDDPKGKLKSDLWATVSATATIGALQTVIDQKKMDGPILGRYERDETRRQNELSRFGKRALWPGDSSEGVLYLAETGPMDGAVVSLPVNTLYNAQDQIVLRAHR